LVKLLGPENYLTYSAFKWCVDLKNDFTNSNLSVRRKLAKWVIEQERAMVRIESNLRGPEGFDYGGVKEFFRQRYGRNKCSKSRRSHRTKPECDTYKGYCSTCFKDFTKWEDYRRYHREECIISHTRRGSRWQACFWTSWSRSGDELLKASYSLLLADALSSETDFNTRVRVYKQSREQTCPMLKQWVDACFPFPNGLDNPKPHLVILFRNAMKNAFGRCSGVPGRGVDEPHDIRQKNGRLHPHWEVDCDNAGCFIAGRRRLPETSSVSPQDPSTPALSSGSPTGLIAVLLLALAFLFYWFVVRRFRRPVRKPRDSLRDLEAGCAEVGRSLCLE